MIETYMDKLTCNKEHLYHTEWVYQRNRQRFKLDVALATKPQCNIRFIALLSPIESCREKQQQCNISVIALLVVTLKCTTLHSYINGTKLTDSSFPQFI